MSKKIKLSQREQIVLKAIQDGARVIYFPYQGRFNPNAYYDVDGVGRCSAQVKKLIKIGLLLEEREGYGGYRFSLTDKGKNYKVEIDEPQEIWAAENHFGKVAIYKYKGFLNGATFIFENGSTARESDKVSFFQTRDSAFDYAIKQQEMSIQSAKSRVKIEERYLQEILKHQNNEEMDKPGYL